MNPNPVVQVLKMRRLFPQFRYSGRNGSYVFTGMLQPRIHSHHYLVKIVFKVGRDPKVFVLEPPIEDYAPHRYPGSKALCLYSFKLFRWDDSLFLADYIIPWAATWLYFYEIWKETDRWYGEEAPHLANETKIEKD